MLDPEFPFKILLKLKVSFYIYLEKVVLTLCNVCAMHGGAQCIGGIS